MRALLLVLLILPVALGQTQVLEDAPGDATATVADSPAPGVDPAGFDLLSLSVEESRDTFAFTLHMAQIAPPNPTPNDSAFILIDLSHGDRDYRLQLGRDSFTGSNSFWARFQAFDTTRDGYVTLENIPDVVIEEGENTATLEIPRSWLLDRNGAEPAAGRELDQFRVSAVNRGIFSPDFVPPTPRIADRMPDEGYGALAYSVQEGLSQDGSASLECTTPFRASNGEKGTFVYNIKARNDGSEEERFALALRGAPSDWDIILPGDTIRLQAGEVRHFPVIVGVPFAHQHGAVESFVLEMASQTTESVGRVELGLRYLAVPQPAGHHDTLHIHTVASTDSEVVPGGLFKEAPSRAYFNTLEDDEKDDEVGVPPYRGSIAVAEMVQWELFLEPGLEMGLDFDLSRKGEFTARFSDATGLRTASMDGYIEHVRASADGDPLKAIRTTVATIGQTEPQVLGSSTTFETVVHPTRASDLVPFARDVALRMFLNLTFPDARQPSGGDDTSTLLMEGTFTLPLNEYRDSLDDVFNPLAGLQFVNNGPKERLVNPGETVLFNLTVTNSGAVDDSFSLRANGTNEAWARVLGDQEILVPTGTSRPVVVAVSPPEGAPNGDIIDLIVTAASKAEPSLQGNIRVVAVVDDVLDHPDESALVQGLDEDLATPKNAPGLPLLAVLATIAISLRRRL